MEKYIEINGRKIGAGHSIYIIAEMSANHNGDYSRAVEIVHAAKESGADAIKLQTYTPDTLTLNCDNDCFRIGKGTIWVGKNLYELYSEAYTPWEWQPKLKTLADELDLDLFSTPFDDSAVDFLEKMNVPAYKIASFELVDIPLIKRVAATGKPVIMSTGMATLSEIDEAVQAFRDAGGRELAFLKCTSAYPAEPAEMNLRTIPDMARRFNVPTGLSDHTLGTVVPIAAVSIGACIVEKHFTLSRSLKGPDSAFSLEPDEFKSMVDAVRDAEKSLGRACYEVGEKENASRVFRRSLFVVSDMTKGESITPENVRSIRPGYGLAPKYLPEIIGRKVTKNITSGTPLTWDMIAS